MTIAEKAKAYDEALKKLHEIITMDNHPVLPKEIGAFLFPQLAESEDERIGNLIYCIVRDREDVRTTLESNGVSVDKALSYLKKQEQSEVDLKKEEFVGVAESPLKTFPRVNEFECGGSYRH